MVTSGSTSSSVSFPISEGLQQGTVNASPLFNVFNSDFINLFGLNNNNSTYSIAFADDLVVPVAGKYPSELRDKLEELENNINNII